MDGTPNKKGTITQYIELEFKIHKRKRKHRLLVTGLGNQQIILGFTWLKEMNPIIDWKKRTLEWRKWKHSVLKRQPDDSKTIKYYAFAQNAQEKTIQEEERPNYIQNPLNETELSTIISTITGDMEDRMLYMFSHFCVTNVTQLSQTLSHGSPIMTSIYTGVTTSNNWSNC